MTSSYLDLNKNNIRKSVISKLKALGYKIDDGANIRDIQNIIKTIQRGNGLMIDGCIGRRTMPLLGYSTQEISKMLKISKRTNYRPICYPYWWLLWC